MNKKRSQLSFWYDAVGKYSNATVIDNAVCFVVNAYDMANDAKAYVESINDSGNGNIGYASFDISSSFVENLFDGKGILRTFCNDISGDLAEIIDNPFLEKVTAIQDRLIKSDDYIFKIANVAGPDMALGASLLKLVEEKAMYNLVYNSIMEENEDGTFSLNIDQVRYYFQDFVAETPAQREGVNRALYDAYIKINSVDEFEDFLNAGCANLLFYQDGTLFNSHASEWKRVNDEEIIITPQFCDFIDYVEREGFGEKAYLEYTKFDTYPRKDEDKASFYSQKRALETIMMQTSILSEIKNLTEEAPGNCRLLHVFDPGNFDMRPISVTPMWQDDVKTLDEVDTLRVYLPDPKYSLTPLVIDQYRFCQSDALREYPYNYLYTGNKERANQNKGVSCIGIIGNALLSEATSFIMGKYGYALMAAETTIDCANECSKIDRARALDYSAGKLTELEINGQSAMFCYVNGASVHVQYTNQTFYDKHVALAFKDILGEPSEENPLIIENLDMIEFHNKLSHIKDTGDIRVDPKKVEVTPEGMKWRVTPWNDIYTTEQIDN